MHHRGLQDMTFCLLGSMAGSITSLHYKGAYNTLREPREDGFRADTMLAPELLLPADKPGGH